MSVLSAGPSATVLASPSQQWLSMDDFCAELGVAKATAYKWSSAGSGSGKFPRFRRLPNGSIRIRRDWFEKWVDGLGPSA